jgi:VanZ family protein
VQEVVSSNLTSPTISEPLSTLPQKKRRAAWPIILAALIFVASHRPAPEGPDIIGTDKVVHFGVYGLLATLICRIGSGWQAALWGFAGATVYGAFDEWHQSFIPARSTEFADWVADALGAALAVALYAGWPRYRQWLEQSRRLGRRKPADKQPAPVSS